MRLDDVRGFVFDVDGTLVRRFPDGVHPLPGAVEVLDGDPRLRPPARDLHQRQPHAARAVRPRAARRRAAGRRRGDGHAGAQRAVVPAPPPRAARRCCCSPSRRCATLLMRRGRRRRRRRRDAAASCSSCTSTTPTPRPRARRARDPRRRAAADRELPARLRRRERPDLQPRRDGDRGDREGGRRPPDGRRQAVARGGAGAARRASACRPRTCS